MACAAELVDLDAVADTEATVVVEGAEVDYLAPVERQAPGPAARREQQLVEAVHDALVVRHGMPGGIEGDRAAPEVQLGACFRGRTPDALLGLALPQALGERRAIVGRVRLGADQADGAGGVRLPDTRDRRIRRHPAADDEIRVARHSTLHPDPYSDSAGGRGCQIGRASCRERV